MKNLALIILFLLPLQANSQSRKDQIFVNALNEYRASKGLPPVIYDSVLSKAAEHHTLYLSKLGSSTHNQDSNFSNFREIRKYQDRVKLLAGSSYIPVAEICSHGWSIENDNWFFRPGEVITFPANWDVVIPPYTLTQDLERDEAISELKYYIASKSHNEILLKPGNLKVGVSFRNTASLSHVAVFARN